MPDANGRTVPNTLPIIARWKILDNLRRSLMPPAIVALLRRGLDVPAGIAGVLDDDGAAGAGAFRRYIQVGRSIGSRAAGVPLREHLRAETDTIVTSVRQAAFSIIMLSHQSVVMLDAIGRVLVRVDDHAPWTCWSGSPRIAPRPRMRRSGHRSAKDVAGAGARLWRSACSCRMVAPGSLLLASPVLILWFISPVVAYSSGRPLTHRRAPVDAGGACDAARARAADLAFLRGADRAGRQLARARTTIS